MAVARMKLLRNKRDAVVKQMRRDIAMLLQPGQDATARIPLIEKLSVRTPTSEVKLKAMKEIAKEHQIEWDTTEFKMELLKPPEELIEGPNTFVSATSLPLKLTSTQSAMPNKPTIKYSGSMEGDTVHFEDTAAAAKAAKKAIAAAEAAVYLANRGTNRISQPFGTPVNSHRDMCDQSEAPERIYKSQTLEFLTTQLMKRRGCLPIQVLSTEDIATMSHQHIWI